MSEHEPKVILCIDDNDQLLECMELYLCNLGHKVLTASSGTRALEMIDVHTVDAVIVDGQMPGMDGGEVAMAMRRMGLHTPIIMFSGMFSGEGDVPNDTLELVDAFVSKGRSDALRSVAQCLDSLLLTTVLQASGAAIRPEGRGVASRW
jgi:CheY-like chemotaxis protein